MILYRISLATTMMQLVMVQLVMVQLVMVLALLMVLEKGDMVLLLGDDKAS